MSITPDSTHFDYHAFISYSHSGDRELARALQSSLEDFARPLFRGRSMRLYRDETNLSARPDLWGAIESALNASSKLILLTSPAAARSEWVPREVKHFVDKRGRQNVCIVQTMGELPWTSLPGGFHVESPDAGMRGEVLDLLRRPGVEPLVIDLRPFRGSTALLSRAGRAEYESKIAALAAELLGRDKDEIYGEHIRRQRRTVQTAASAAMLFFALAAMAIYEWRESAAARDLAEQRRVLADAGRADAIMNEPWRWTTGLAVAIEAASVSHNAKAPLPFELVGALVRGAWQATPYKVLDAHTARATVSLAGDKTRLLTVGRNELRLWDAPYDRNVSMPLARGEDVRGVFFAPDGRRLATIVDGPLVRIRDAVGKVVRELSIHTGAVFSVSLSPPRGDRVITAGEDGSVWVTSVSGDADGRPMRLHSGEGQALLAVYSPDGKHVLVVEDGAIPRLIDASNGSMIALLGEEAWWQAHPCRVGSVAFSSTGAFLVTTGDDQQIHVWDASSGNHLDSYDGHSGPVNSADISSDGTRVVSAGEDMSVRVWDRARSIHTVLRGHSGPVRAAFFLADGRVLSAADDHTVRIWDAEPEPDLIVLRGMIRASCGQFTSSTAARIVTVDGHAVRQWDSATGELLDSYVSESGPIASAMFSSDGKRIITVTETGLIDTWDVQARVRQLSFGNRDVHLYSASLSPDGQRIVTAGRTRAAPGRGVGIAQVWRADSGQLERTLAGHVGPIYTAAFSPDGTRVVTGGADSSVRLWDVLTGKQLQRFDGHTKHVATACFSPDGTRIATGADDGTARIWETRGGRELATVEGHADTVRTVFFAHDAASLFTASDDRSIGWWRTSTGERLGRIDLGDDAHGVAGALDKQRLLVTMANETWIRTFSAQDAIRRGCEVLRPLSSVSQISAESLAGIHRTCDEYGHK